MLRYTSRSDDPHTHYRKTEKNRVSHGEDSIVVSTVNDRDVNNGNLGKFPIPYI